MNKEHKKGEAYCEDGYIHGKVDTERGNISKAFGDMIDNAKPDVKVNYKVSTLDESLQESIVENIDRQTSIIMILLDMIEEKDHELAQDLISNITSNSFMAGFHFTDNLYEATITKK